MAESLEILNVVDNVAIAIAVLGWILENRRNNKLTDTYNGMMDRVIEALQKQATTNQALKDAFNARIGSPGA